MAGKTNYDFERRERDRAKQAKKEAKAREKAGAQTVSSPEQPSNLVENPPVPPQTTDQ